MEFKDYYKILGVKSDADTKAIKKAYRQLAHKYHPDMNPSSGAETKFKEVAEAYQVLKDKKLRAEFDELRQYGSRSDKGFQPPPGWNTSHQSNYQSDDYSEFFNSIFGTKGREPRQTRGQDVEIELPIFLEETLKETSKEIEYNLPINENGQLSQLKKRLKVKVPQGVIDGERIRLAGQGKQGYQGGSAGDLYLHIRVVPHPLFDVSGHDILITLPLAPWEAALGMKVTVPTLEGKLNLTIPANTPSGKKFRLKGKGLKTKTATGDLYAVVKVVMPANNSEKSKQLWQDLADDQTFNPRKEWSE